MVNRKNFFTLCFHQEPSSISGKNKVFEETKWFPGAKLNFAENLLTVNRDKTNLDKQIAIVGLNELGERVIYMYAELYKAVSRWMQALSAVGVKFGDRVAGYMPNLPETVIAMLATTALGGVWSSCSPDFGEHGLRDRFAQINPTVIVTTDGYTYKGKPLVTVPKLNKLIDEIFSNKNAEILEKEKPNLTKIVVIPCGKISEKTIADIINKRERVETNNTGALANPDSLEFYRELIKKQSIQSDLF